MAFRTDIAAALSAEGLRVEYVAGWQTRGSSAFNPGGVTCHWTAGPRGTHSRPSLNVVVNGRPGISGPLCNVYLSRDGVAVIVAAGRANHAGLGGYRGLVGNSSVYGIEAECGGDGDWTDAQRETYPRVVAALLRTIGRDASWAMGHNEWAPDRKIDIRDYDMARMRRDVAQILALAPGATSGVGNVSASGKPTLAVGSQNSYVAQLQTFFGITADGIFGAETQTHVGEFQRQHGLTVDGIVGPATWAAIEAEIASAEKSRLEEESRDKMLIIGGIRNDPQNRLYIGDGVTRRQITNAGQLSHLKAFINGGFLKAKTIETYWFDNIDDLGVDVTDLAKHVNTPSVAVDVDEQAIVDALVGPLTAALVESSSLSAEEVEAAVRKALSGATINPA